ncbi:MAG: hypothetical protein K8R89_04350 [Anaerolineae bacterium]|nr:hypothetical protein [Anaerolineae bacterium]
MQSPFWENLQAALNRLKGRSLVLAVMIWFLLLGTGLFCAFGSLSLPTEGVLVPATEEATKGPSSEAAAPETGEEPAPTATLPVETIIIPTPTPAPFGAEPTAASLLPPLPWGEFGYGAAVQGVIPVIGDYTYSMRQVKEQLGFNWVKQQLRWDDIYHTETGQPDWGLYDPVVEAAHEMGLKLMLSIVDSPEWTRSYIDADPLGAPPDDLTLYANFVGEVVDRYKGKVHAIEVWNEQNLNREWDTANGLNPERYVEMLRLAYQAIESRDPSIVVISGALSPTGMTGGDSSNANRLIYMDDYTYLTRMIEAGFLDYVDCIGVHHNGINMPPDVAWNEGYNDPTASFRGPFDNPHHSWSFKSTIWDYYTMAQQAGYNKPLCLTEFGWASAEGWSAVAESFDFAWDNTLEEQAKWDVQAFQLMRQWGFIQLAFIWNLDYAQKGGGGETDPNAPYSLLNFDGSPRPAYGALGEMPKIP